MPGLRDAFITWTVAFLPGEPVTNDRVEDFIGRIGGSNDVQTAVEAYTPIYALFLPREDFLRAVNSLQLDEVIAIYIAKILGNDYHLAFMKNGHPLVPLSTLEAGYRLMMHGLDVEGLHGWLRILKRRQAAGLPIDPRSPTAAATV
jgi:hypothetical protein